MKYINRECQGEWRRNRIYQQFQYGRCILNVYRVTLWIKWRLLCVYATQACLCALGGFPSKGQHKMCRNNADQRAQDQASHFWLISSVIINTSSWWWFHDRPSFVVALCREFIDIFLRLFEKTWEVMMMLRMGRAWETKETLQNHTKESSRVSTTLKVWRLIAQLLTSCEMPKCPCLFQV